MGEAGWGEVGWGSPVHGWMDSHPSPRTGSVPSPFPSCCSTAQPLKLSLNFIPALTAQDLQSRVPLLSLAWELLYPETLPRAWSGHASVDRAVFLKCPSPGSPGMMLYSTTLSQTNAGLLPSPEDLCHGPAHLRAVKHILQMGSLCARSCWDCP